MNDLHYHVNEIPSLLSILLFGLQQMMIDDGLFWVQMFSATFVTSGIATILQTTFGMRLSILHGPSFAFLPALHTFQATFPCDADTIISNWEEKMQMISGSCLIAVLIMPLLGFTGLIGVISKYIGPVTIVPIMSLLTIGTVPDIEEKMGMHWISIVEFLILVAFVVFLGQTAVPIPVFSFKEKKIKFTRQKIFSQFPVIFPLPYLLGIIFAWIICLILTVTNAEPYGGAARTDNNASLTVFKETPFVHVPLPLFFGAPKFNAALICGFMASCFAAMIESIGDYNLCAKISKQSPPPPSNTNRAFVVEGVGCILAALWGVGTGITCYAENIAIMSVTKVTSRITMQMAGVLLILAGVISKFAAFLSMIPEPIIGGLLAMGVCLINGVSLSNLQTVDMKISRNLTIIGIAIVMAITTASHFEKTSLNTGNKTIDDVFGTLLTIRMLIGGLIAFTLDNIAPGATRRQRGFLDDDDEEKEEVTSLEFNGYALPSFINQFLLKYYWLTHLPVIPSRREIEDIEDERKGMEVKKEKF
ncbi:hypothetical protein CAEBREN_29885 [Caenorhabditis brenneri]|uniref:Uncharacterized protein n=1 Tax=Caenorhabditis brenneri TaxID=135651 RepID=G0NLW1_CAEBE|nr:hypothetical protein CAEBREN_29885 [Caenorhabditis brenneri]